WRAHGRRRSWRWRRFSRRLEGARKWGRRWRQRRADGERRALLLQPTIGERLLDPADLSVGQWPVRIALLDLDQVPAELRLHWLGDGPRLEGERGVGKCRNHLLAREPA